MSDAPAAEMVMDALSKAGRYPLMPIGRTAGSTDTATLDGAAPVVGKILSQLRLLVAVQVSVPPPWFVMFSVWLGGAPCCLRT